MIKSKRILTAILAAIILAGLAFFGLGRILAPAQASSRSGSLPESAAQTQPAVPQVSAEGQVVPAQHASLAFQTGGQIQTILVAEGKTVSAGTPLLRLASSDQEIALRQAEAALARSQANLATAQADLNTAQAVSRASQVAVQAAEAELTTLSADPRPAELALANGAVAAAEAGTSQAIGNRNVVVEAATPAEIDAARAQLAAAQTYLFATRIADEPTVQNQDAGSERRTEAQLRLDAAYAQVAAAQAELDQLLAGATSAEQQAVAGAVAAARSQETVAQAEKELLAAGPRPEELAVAEAQVARAQSSQTEAELWVTLAEAAVRRAAAEVGLAEGQVAAAQSALDKRTLFAPFDGTVASLMVKQNEVTQAGIPVLVLADFRQWQIKTTDLTELQVVKLSPGIRMAITLDAVPGITLEGTVSEISSSAQMVRGDVTYQATITLAPPAELPLRWGMTAFVTDLTD